MRKLALRVKRRRLLSTMIALVFCSSAMLGLLVTSSSDGTDISVRGGPTSKDATPVRTLALAAHDPIIIVGDENFTVENGVTQGTGTHEDPYVIQGWDIDRSLGNGVDISNTRASFTLRNVYVHASSGGLSWGIILSNVTNSSIQGVTMAWGSNVRVFSSSNATVRDSNLSDSAIFVVYCNDVIVENNNLSNSNIDIDRSTGVHVESNRITHLNEYRGISLSDCQYAVITDNTVLNCTMGIAVTGCSHGLIVRNNVSNQYDTIAGVISIDLDESSNMSVYHNNFVKAYRQNEPGGVDWDGDDNTWDDGYPSGGNYWADFSVVDVKSGPNQDQSGSDGIGDSPKYLTSQTQGFPGSPVDRYPLMKPWTSSWNPDQNEDSVPGEVQIGVKAGDWIRLDYKISGAPFGTLLPTWIKMEFLSVEGTKATVRITMHMSDGTEQNATAPIDIVAGGEALGLSGFVIPANCTTGDSIYMSGYGNLTIAGETTRTYAGARRTVVYASLSQYGAQATYYWDKQTGVMVEASTTSGTMTATAKATETDMWEARSSGALANSTVIFALVIAAVVIVVAVAFLVIRRRRGPPEVESPESFEEERG